MCLPSLAQAAESVTVAQLDQRLVADHRLSDDKLSAQLANLTLSERVAPGHLASWQTSSPGPRTRQLLMLLADASAFQPLPASERAAAPFGFTDSAKLLAAAFSYASQASHNLPNLLAVRRTLHYQTPFDALAKQARAAALNASASGFLGLDVLPQNFTGQSHAAVAYQDGEEVPTDEPSPPGSSGYTTSGEFGPLLTTVVGDATQGSILLDSWQRSGDADVAVFRYQVPRGKAHYLVAVQDGDFRRQSYPGYHGEIAVDARTGSILRISLVTEPLKFTEPSVGIAVEYGSVILGSRAYIVPLHTVALTRYPVDIGLGAVIPVQSYLNDVVFTRYHLFRAEARIVDPEEAR
ncbi:hypothetical protein [Acidipila sp. EB88]|uniref:hypothetical protein n=1 Tax=Acidipila sp. EB88 TaxID=2305226 RepID=UPI000F5F9EA6|nr:hypothetical protein [Acidipila sp. EB88]RRA49196.1 hypothetical protein D1Y84_13870 [Acidipila sp. EB88]